VHTRFKRAVTCHVDYKTQKKRWGGDVVRAHALPKGRDMYRDYKESSDFL